MKRRMLSLRISTVRPCTLIVLLCGMCTALGGCTTAQPLAVANDPVYEQCEREARLITSVAIKPGERMLDEHAGSAPSAAGEAIEDARAARDEADEVGLAAWPEQALLFRCLAANSIRLRPEQAEVLAKWESTGAAETGDP